MIWLLKFAWLCFFAGVCFEVGRGFIQAAALRALRMIERREKAKLATAQPKGPAAPAPLPAVGQPRPVRWPVRLDEHNN